MRRALTIVLLIAFGTLTSVTATADDVPPDKLVHQVADRILDLIKKNRDDYSTDHSKLYAMVDREVLPYFDFRVMSRSVLGRYWRRADDAQRQRFVKEFRELLVRTYATALLKYTDQKIRYLPVFAKPDDKTVLVRTEVTQSGSGNNIPMNYSFYHSKDGWKVYDVSIEGVSLVTTYRSTYSEKIRNQGLDALIGGLEQDNRRAQAGGSAPAKK